MKPFLTVVVMCLLVVAPSLRADTLSPDDQYFNIYSRILRGDRLDGKGRMESARTNYLEAATELKKFQEDFPLWNPAVVKYRLNYLEMKLAAPEPAAPGNAPRATSHPNGKAKGSEMMDKSTDAGKPVELKLKWQVGKRYEQQMDMTMDSDVDVPGQSQPMKQKIKLGEGYAISGLKEREGGGKELDFQVTSINMNMDMGGTTLMSFDSKSPSGDAGANPATAIMQKMADLHLKLLTDASGKVEKVEGLKEFLDGMGGADAAGGADAFKGMLSEDTIKQMASLQGLPDHPVKVGDSWPVKTEISVPALGTLVTEMTYTFTGWEQRDDHKCAILSFTGSLYSKPPEDGAAAPMVSMDDGKANGQVLFDAERGLPVETSAIQTIAMKINVQGQSMSSKMTQDMDTKLASVTDIPK